MYLTLKIYVLLSFLQGGMSNEMYNTIARVTDGIYEGKFLSYVEIY